MDGRAENEGDPAAKGASHPRSIIRVHDATGVMEGAGVLVRRALPSHEVPYEDVDPFLLLDYFDSSEASVEGQAFPKHPHRGFEILTYLLSGASAHSGTVGDGTILRGGGIQKITAGRGIWHGEGGGQEGDEPVRGLQLWVNLPRSDKAIAPDYQMLDPAEVPVKEEGHARVRVLVGEPSPIHLRTSGVYLDVTLKGGGGWGRDIAEGHQGFVFVLDGSGRFGTNEVTARKGQLLVLGAGKEITVTSGEEGVRFVLGAAKPHREPVRWNGPFVD